MVIASCLVSLRAWLEPCVDLGQSVAKGDVVARVHAIERTGEQPIDYRARISGVLAGRHFPGLIEMGDPVAMIAVPV
jgi:N-alpha-acetyl-L-2,4-diaminobutyrate deacetylase